MDDYELVGNGGDGNRLHTGDDRDALAEARRDLERGFGIEAEVRETGGA